MPRRILSREPLGALRSVEGGLEVLLECRIRSTGHHQHHVVRVVLGRHHGSKHSSCFQLRRHCLTDMHAPFQMAVGLLREQHMFLAKAIDAWQHDGHIFAHQGAKDHVALNQIPLCQYHPSRRIGHFVHYIQRDGNAIKRQSFGRALEAVQAFKCDLAKPLGLPGQKSTRQSVHLEAKRQHDQDL